MIYILVSFCNCLFDIEKSANMVLKFIKLTKKKRKRKKERKRIRRKKREGRRRRDSLFSLDTSFRIVWRESTPGLFI